MGLIKTAMMSGAAIYGVSQLSKVAQSRNATQQPRREYSDRDYDSHRPRPLEFRDRDSQDQRHVDARDLGDSDRMYNREPRQRMYLEDQRPAERQAYYMPGQYDNQPQYEYASTPPQYYSAQRGQQGFVEPEDTMDDPRAPQGGSRADVVNMLAQQAMSMGLVGGNKGKKDKGSKGDLLSSLMSK